MNKIPSVIGRGTNNIPLIHVKDLSLFVNKILED